MRGASREAPFAAFVEAYRARLLDTATLIYLDRARADELVEAVLARVYADWTRLDDPYGYAVRAVVRPAAAGIRLAEGAHPVRRFELVDVGARAAARSTSFVAGLAALPEEERRILVLAHLTRLPARDIATLLQRELDDVVADERAARTRLDEASDGRSRPLAAELRTALDTDLSGAGSRKAGSTGAGPRAAGPPAAQPSADSSAAARGRALLRRRQLRAVALVAAVLVVAGLGIRQLGPGPAQPVAAPEPAAASPSPRASCDVRSPLCRADLVAAWRAQMATLVSEYLDPNGLYFTGLNYSYTDPSFGDGYFEGRAGALGVDLYRRDGATEVYLQIATDRAHAIPCGQLTGRECTPIRFMDGNAYLLSEPWDVAHGLEAQHRPEGTYVVTVVARNTSRTGRQLDLTRGDLVRLISDPRLRLPPR